MNETVITLGGGLFVVLAFVWFMCVLHGIWHELKRGNDMAAMPGRRF